MFQFFLLGTGRYFDSIFRGLSHILCNLFPQGPLDVAVYTEAVIFTACTEEVARLRAYEKNHRRVAPAFKGAI